MSGITSVGDGPDDGLTATERAAGCVHRNGAALKVGDLLWFLSSGHRITHFTDYEGVLHTRHGGPLPEGTRIAHSGPRWGMTIDPTHSYRVVDETPREA